MPTTQTKQIGIVGGGLLGRVLALSLVQKGYALQIFDADALGGEKAAGLTAAGMLAPFAEMETADSQLLELGLKSLKIWPGLVNFVGVSDAFQQRGSLILAHSIDQPELTHFIKQLQAKVDLAEQIQVLNRDDITALEPELSQHSNGYFFPIEGLVNAQAFMENSQTFLCQHPQVIWHAGQTVELLDSNVVSTAGQAHAHIFDRVFDTRGLGAKSDLLELRGVRGEVFWLDAPSVNLTRPVRLMHPRYRIYIVPRPNHRYVVGATEIESEDVSPMSVRSSLELLSAVYSVHSGFGEARIVKTLTNCRPAMPDNLPRIVHEKGLTRLNGLYRHGYLLAPALVEQALLECGL